jgi:hypothetical protein
MKKRPIVVGAGVLFFILIAAAYAYFRTDPVVTEMQQLRDEMSSRDLPDADRRAQWNNFRQRMDSLSEDQRRAVWESGRERFERFGRQRMDEFFQLPPAEQKKRLDEIIDRMQARQQNPNAGRGGPPGGRGLGGGRNMTEGQRDQRRKEMISRTDPKMRARFDQFRQLLGDRMNERGIQPPPGGRMGRG